ncbi:TetR/AcrR family transcriptional regulator [Yinghuangia soli]|uniref:TetR/AcrR family transcriptional regulator n=1 Tax=Yinghuangia soli TaxID=2908204 RepID=A0AA41U549_9ACTN|nr:TetR/AcrR family transcriptional regulator [Yinghuangia soli]MCF2529634.1 TetR/AcrR family transcriptional regulator [Yinghuangia soli]
MTTKTPNAARRSEASRRAILTAAFELAGEIGYAKLTIEAIAARAGVGKQTIYRWWPSKGAVLFDAFLMLSEGQLPAGVGDGGEAEGEAAVGDTAAALPDTGDLEADLKAVLRATVAELADPRYDLPLRGLTSEIMHDADLAALYAERLHEPVQEMKRTRLRAARAAGQLDPDVDLDVAVELMWGPVLSRWLMRTAPLTEEFADSVVEAALRGLAPKA